MIPYQIKDIEDFPGYRIDTEGNVFSCWTVAGRYSKCSNVWKKLIPNSNKKYLQIKLCNSTGKFQKYIHRLVLETFVGKVPAGMEGCHNDGDSRNNCLKNLRWDTSKNNQADRINHGTVCCGEKQGGHKLNRFQVQRIRLMREISPRLSQAKIGKIFHVAQGTIKDILSRKTWKHIS